MKQAVILAGGLGTRLRPYTYEHPKPMIMVEGVPFLERILRQVFSWGIEEAVLLLGYKAEEIQDYLGDGNFLGGRISYHVTPVEYDTGARIRSAREMLEDEFILLYCDNYCPLDLSKAYLQFLESNALVQVTAYANKDGYTRNNLLHENGMVLSYDKKRVAKNLNAVDIGYSFVRKRILEDLPEGNCNFEASLYPKLAENGEMGCFVTEHRYYSIGSWERMELTKEFFHPKKVIFLDRDGTLNERPSQACYVEKPEEFRWIPGAREAVKLLKDHGYRIYLITNQPGIARGNLTTDTLDAIHEKMQTDLRLIGTEIDDIYMCPHGWDEGCDCRKPKPGMLYQAQREHSLDLTKCVLVGDDERDIAAGTAAGIPRNVLLRDDYCLWDAVQDVLKEERKI